ncbi:MAG TPA: hypothetical protein VLF94_04880 [Chlamydiales bacterium]|nr:hypothetical protein [Chlamydiales bacterium]
MRAWTYWCFLSSLVGVVYSEDVLDQPMSYESLIADPWTDHVRSFHQLFQVQSVDNFLEFGMGRATHFFLKHCQNVTSIELVVESRRKDVEPWYEKCNHAFSIYTHWCPSMHVFSARFDIADQRAHEQLDPATIDNTYLLEIDQLCDQVFCDQHFDLVFVDPGTHIRGDIVNALFNRADIIAAHDTACTQHRMFGYYKVRCPDNYEEIVSKYGSGVTFWINREKKELINELKNRLSEF